MDILEKVHRTAWSIVMNNFDHGLRNVWKTEAQSLRCRLLLLLGASSPSSEGIDMSDIFSNAQLYIKAGQKLCNNLDPVFSTLLQLKVDLQLSEHYYETIFPASGEIFDPAFMQTEGGLSSLDDISEGSVVLLSLAPAIIQYAKDSIGCFDSDKRREMLCCGSVKATKVQRAKGRVLGRAIVQIG